MKRLLPTLLMISLFVASSLTGCRGKGSTRIATWQSAFPESDSMMRAVDEEMQRNADMEIINPILDKIDSLAEALGDKQLKARSLYQKARFQRLHGQDSIGEIFIRQALQLADSAAYPYDNARFANLYLKEIYPGQIDRFRQLKNSLVVYIAANDSFRVSETYNRIGVFYREVYDYGKAAEYYGKSREWINPTQTDILFKLEFNRALLYKAENDRDSMKAIFRRLLDNPVKDEYPKLHCIILENSYRLFGGVEHLRKAYSLEMSMAKDDPVYYYPTETASLLTRYFKRKQILDSAAYYAHIAIDGIATLEPEAEEVPRIISKYYQVIGKNDSAKYYENIANGFLYQLMEEKAANDSLKEQYSDQLKRIEGEMK